MAKIKFIYSGKVYDNNDKLLDNIKELITHTISAKAAISNLSYQIKKQLNLPIDTKIYLVGNLVVQFQFDSLLYTVNNNILIYDDASSVDVAEYTRPLSDGKLKLNKNATKRYYVDLFNIFGNNSFTREEFLDSLFNLKNGRAVFVVKEKGKQLSMFDYQELEPVSDTTFVDSDQDEWIFDPNEGVYWKNGIKYGEYLTSLD